MNRYTITQARHTWMNPLSRNMGDRPDFPGRLLDTATRSAVIDLLKLLADCCGRPNATLLLRGRSVESAVSLSTGPNALSTGQLVDCVERHESGIGDGEEGKLPIIEPMIGLPVPLRGWLLINGAAEQEDSKRVRELTRRFVSPVVERLLTAYHLQQTNESLARAEKSQAEQERLKGQLQRDLSALTSQIDHRTGVLSRLNNKLLKEIEQHQQTNETLRWERNLAQLYLEATRQFVVALDDQLKLTMINRSGAELLNRTPLDAVGIDWVEQFVAQSARAEARQVLHEVLSTPPTSPRVVEWPLLRSNSEEHIIIWQIHRLPIRAGVGGLLCSGQDVTARRQAENALRRTEVDFRRLCMTMPEAVAIHTAGKVVFANPAAASKLGYDSVDELVGLPIIELLHPNYRPLAFQRMARMQETGETAELIQECFIDKQGREVPAEVTAFPMLFDGRPSYVAIGRDMTERVRAAEAIQVEKERLTVTLQSIGDAVITTDTEGRVCLINEVAEFLTGWSQNQAEQVALPEVFRLFDPKTGALRDSPVNLLASGRAHSLVTSGRLCSRSGLKRIVAVSATTIQDRRGTLIGLVLVFRDITESQKKEEEQFKQEKLESVGKLAGGIAHDFNNILTAITANLSLARTMVEPEDRLNRILDAAESAAFRAGNLTRQLLTFASGGAPVKKVTSLASLIRDASALGVREGSVACTVQLPSNLWQAEVDEGQLAHALTNLVVNGVQAMPDGGTIEVSAENLEISSGQLPLPAGRYIKLCVGDAGVGIPRSLVAKIFDPYFTTRSEGSGLGLASVYSIIKQHGGLVTVESEVGQGSLFTLYLPAADPLSESGPQVAARGGGKRILVMDDEPAVAEALSELLQLNGYRTISTADGKRAIACFEEARAMDDPFDAVIMDLNVPGGMGGKETIACLRQLDASVPAVVSSGYSNDPVMADFRTHGFDGVLSKPYNSRTLFELLHSLIEPES